MMFFNDNTSELWVVNIGICAGISLLECSPPCAFMLLKTELQNSNEKFKNPQIGRWGDGWKKEERKKKRKRKKERERNNATYTKSL